MKTFRLFTALLLTLCVVGAEARLTNADLQRILYFPGTNLGFENGKTGWTNSNGTFDITTSLTDVGEGSVSGSFNAASSGDYLITDAINVEPSKVGLPCSFTISIKGDASLYNLQLVNSADDYVYSTTSGLSNSSYAKYGLETLSCPAIVKFKLIATGDGGLVYIDSGKLNTDSSLVKSLTDIHTFVLSGGAGSSAKITGFSKTNEKAEGANLLFSNNTIIALKPVAINLALIATNVGSSPGRIYVYLNGIADFGGSIQDNTTGGWASLVPYVRALEAGDYIEFYASASSVNNVKVLVEGRSSSEYVITPASTRLQTMTLTQNNTSMTNVTAEFEYALATATITNFFGGVSTAYGSTAQSFYALDDAANTRTKFIFNQAGTAIVHLNTMVGVNSVYPAIYLNGSVVALGANTSAASGYGTVAHSVSVSKGSYISVGINSGAIYTGAVHPVTTSITFIPDYANLLSAIPTQQTCYIKDVKAYNVDGGSSAATTHYVRTLNTLNQDGSDTNASCPFATINSNQVTLQKGTYRLRAKAPAFRTNGTILYLRDTSAGATDVYNGLSGSDWSGSAGNYAQVWPAFRGEITLEASKTFELKQYTFGAQTTSGLGQQSGLSGFSSIFAQMEITKIK